MLSDYKHKTTINSNSLLKKKKSSAQSVLHSSSAHSLGNKLHTAISTPTPQLSVSSTVLKAQSIKINLTAPLEGAGDLSLDSVFHLDTVTRYILTLLQHTIRSSHYHDIGPCLLIYHTSPLSHILNTPLQASFIVHTSYIRNHRYRGHASFIRNHRCRGHTSFIQGSTLALVRDK